MKLNLAIPKTKQEMRGLFSNIDSKGSNYFYLLMVFHKSMKGGFDYPITTDNCRAMLKRRNKNYQYQDGIWEVNQKRLKNERI